jgi:hypothetical protein
VSLIRRNAATSQSRRNSSRVQNPCPLNLTKLLPMCRLWQRATEIMKSACCTSTQVTHATQHQCHLRLPQNPFLTS